jgi:ferredoxin--NADP+ reductase
MVSGPSDAILEFYSIIVPSPNGTFSPSLAALQPGDPLYIENLAYGFLTLERFVPSGAEHAASTPPQGDLWLIATGTGLSAYLSILRDPATWQHFQHIILIHGVRHRHELVYQHEINAWSQQAGQAGKFSYLGIPTQEDDPHVPRARLTTLLADGRLEALAHTLLDPTHSKIMLCGNPNMLIDARAQLATRGFVPGRRGVPGNLALENYWTPHAND